MGICVSKAAFTFRLEQTCVSVSPPPQTGNKCSTVDQLSCLGIKAKHIFQSSCNCTLISGGGSRGNCM